MPAQDLVERKRERLEREFQKQMQEIAKQKEMNQGKQQRNVGGAPVSKMGKPNNTKLANPEIEKLNDQKQAFLAELADPVLEYDEDNYPVISDEKSRIDSLADGIIRQIDSQLGMTMNGFHVSPVKKPQQTVLKPATSGVVVQNFTTAKQPSNNKTAANNAVTDILKISEQERALEAELGRLDEQIEKAASKHKFVSRFDEPQFRTRPTIPKIAKPDLNDIIGKSTPELKLHVEKQQQRSVTKQQQQPAPRPNSAQRSRTPQQQQEVSARLSVLAQPKQPYKDKYEQQQPEPDKRPVKKRPLSANIFSKPKEVNVHLKHMIIGVEEMERVKTEIFQDEQDKTEKRKQDLDLRLSSIQDSVVTTREPDNIDKDDVIAKLRQMEISIQRLDKQKTETSSNSVPQVSIEQQQPPQPAPILPQPPVEQNSFRDFISRAMEKKVSEKPVNSVIASFNMLAKK